MGAGPGAPPPGSLVDPLIRRLQQRRGTRLDPIIETIQARQYDLMERPLDRTLVIQGGPGTGKTVIALHRVAVQLYRSHGRLAQSDVLFVGPTRTFVGYVDKVLPALGERQVVHRAVQDLAKHGTSPTEHDPSDVALIKGLPQMAGVIARYLVSRARVPAGGHCLGEGALELVPAGALQPVLERALEEAQDYAELRNRFRRLLSDQDVLRQLAAGSSSQRSVMDPDRADELARLTVRSFSPQQVVHDLLTKPRLLEAAAESLLTLGQQASIRRKVQNVRDHPWTFEDLPLLDESFEQLGSERLEEPGSERSLSRYVHVVIDEAQDFSAMQLRMVRRRSSGSLTILGDLAQATTGWTPSTWDEHLGSGGIEIDDLEELAQSYRTTQPIMAAANNLLLVIDLGLEPPTSIIAHGEPVTALALDDPADDGEVVAEQIVRVRAEARDGDTIGIIGIAATLARIAPDLQAAGLEPRRVDEDVAAPLVLVPVDAAKGLEYDHVLLLEPERIYRTDASTGPRQLYVAMTRARSTLQLLHRDRLPRVFDGVESIVHLAPNRPASQDGPGQAANDIAAVAASPDERPDADALSGLPPRLARRVAEGGSADTEGAARALGPCMMPTGRGEIVLADHPGFDRRDLIAHAERLGFAARAEVHDRTTMVVVGQTDSSSRRARVARELGVPIASAADLLAASPGKEVAAVVLPSLGPR